MNSSQNSYSHVQWCLDITNLYITKSSVQRTICLTLVIAKYMKKYLDITKPRYSKQNYFASPLAVCHIEVPLFFKCQCLYFLINSKVC